MEYTSIWSSDYIRQSKSNMKFDDLDTSSSSEDDLCYLKPPSFSQRGRNSVPVVDIVDTSGAGKPVLSSIIKKTEKYIGSELQEKDDGEDKEEGVTEDVGLGLDKGKVEDLNSEEKEENVFSEEDNFISFHSSESDYSNNLSSDIVTSVVIKQESQDLTEVVGKIMKKDAQCQTIVTGDIISLNLYHGSVTDGKMYGIVTLQDFDKHLDIMQGHLSMK